LAVTPSAGHRIVARARGVLERGSSARRSTAGCCSEERGSARSSWPGPPRRPDWRRDGGWAR